MFRYQMLPTRSTLPDLGKPSYKSVNKKINPKGRYLWEVSGGPFSTLVVLLAHDDTRPLNVTDVHSLVLKVIRAGQTVTEVRVIQGELNEEECSIVVDYFTAHSAIYRWAK